MAEEGDRTEDIAELFGSAGFAMDREQTTRRMQSERIASKTPKQRARRATRTIQLNVRITQETKDLILKLRSPLGESEADFIERAVRELAGGSQ